MVTLAVKDTGRGIPEEVLERFRETGTGGIAGSIEQGGNSTDG
jgi:hypothetical protein